MNIVSATWTNGQLCPLGVMDWPEGTRLQIRPVQENDQNDAVVPGIDDWDGHSGLYADEARFKDDPESIEEWCRAVEALEPIVLTDEERAERDRVRAEWKAFNIEAMRKKMFGEVRR